MRTLLLGTGNPFLSDDAVGVRLVSDFSRRLGRREGLDVIEECASGGIDLLQILEGYDRLLLVDSIQTREGIPGNWYRFTAEKLWKTMHLTGIHDANFATALNLGRQLGIKLPPDEEIHVFAVEVLDNRTFSEKMTERLENNYSAYSKEIFGELEAILREPC